MTDTARSDEGAAPARTTTSRRRWSGPSLSGIALELLIVFVGVSAAFAVEDYRETRDENERRSAIYRALDRELRQVAETHGPSFQREMATQLAAWDAGVERGARPLPPTFTIPGASGPPTAVWDATMATDSIELIDAELFFELGRYYNRARTAGDLHRAYADSARVHVRPFLADGRSAFWNPDGSLKPDIQVHLLRLRDYRERQAALVTEARLMRQKVRQAAAE